MITGSDSVFVACGPVSGAVERFLADWSRRWPRLRVSVGDGEEFSAWEPGAITLPETSGQVLVARDEDMVAGWDDSGYVLDPHQEGPFSLAYEPAGWTSLNVLALDDPYTRTGFGYEPYEIGLVGTGLQLITLVAPEDGAFRQAVTHGLLAALGGPAQTGSRAL
ncbi:hypothetical protein OHA98_16900 [Streptomyces sp. NBC_00654]|uniref:hypothetical protein n=1 Tax=Streptomyces sp. NBC_00654 TaxID=2975799 RepID=UPI00225514F8|nr:hypothetical protein [Streptomyces sp. NBC_00654]MCX4966484.1 hypothetical protein [Streptomyces sp. NBC_00654]